MRDDRPAGHDVTEAELHQEDPARVTAIDPIPVVIEGTVRTIPLPSRSRSAQTFSVSQTPVRLLGNDPRRKIARILSATEDLFYAGSSEELANVTSGSSASSSAQWSRMVPLELTDSAELWATTGDTTTTIVSVITEYWSE